MRGRETLLSQAKKRNSVPPRINREVNDPSINRGSEQWGNSWEDVTGISSQSLVTEEGIYLLQWQRGLAGCDHRARELQQDCPRASGYTGNHVHWLRELRGCCESRSRDGVLSWHFPVGRSDSCVARSIYWELESYHVSEKVLVNSAGS